MKTRRFNVILNKCFKQKDWFVEYKELLYGEKRIIFYFYHLKSNTATIIKTVDYNISNKDFKILCTEINNIVERQVKRGEVK